MKFSKNHAALLATLTLRCGSALALPTFVRTGSETLDIAQRDAGESVPYHLEKRDFLGEYHGYAANEAREMGYGYDYSTNEARELGYNYDYAVNEARDLGAYDYASNEARGLAYDYDYGVNEARELGYNYHAANAARDLGYDYSDLEARELEYGFEMPEARELSPEEAYIAAREELLDELFGRAPNNNGVSHSNTPPPGYGPPQPVGVPNPAAMNPTVKAEEVPNSRPARNVHRCGTPGPSRSSSPRRPSMSESNPGATYSTMRVENTAGGAAGLTGASQERHFS